MFSSNVSSGQVMSFIWFVLKVVIRARKMTVFYLINHNRIYNTSWISVTWISVNVLKEWHQFKVSVER